MGAQSGGTLTTEALQVQLPTGETIRAQVRTGDVYNVTADDAFKRLDIDELRQTVGGVAGTLRQALDDLVPDRLEVEFGLELAVKTGKLVSVLAEAGATASIRVSLSWDGKSGTPTG
jgi:hypothetical protein